MERTHRRMLSGASLNSNNNSTFADAGSQDEEGGEPGAPRRTRSKAGPLPKNGPNNPLFPPLPPKMPRQRNSARSTNGGGSRSGSQRRDDEEEDEDGDEEDRGMMSADTTIETEVPVDEPEEMDAREGEEQPETSAVPAVNPVAADEVAAAPEEKQADLAAAPATDFKEAAGDNSAVHSPNRRQSPLPGSSRSSHGDDVGHEEETDAVEDGEIIEQEQEPDAEKMDIDVEEEVPEDMPEAADPPSKNETIAEAATADEQKPNIAADFKIEESHEDGPHPDASGESKEAEDDADSNLPSSGGRRTRNLRRLSKSNNTGPGVFGEAPGSLSTVAEYKDGQVDADDRNGDEEKDEDMDVDMGMMDDEEEDDEDDGEGKEDVTRCICGKEADNDTAMMISCDECQVWQHGPCVGIYFDEEAPDEYYCEKCKPSLHVCLKRYLKALQKKGIHEFRPPLPQDLLHHHYASDRCKPSQSLRWNQGFKASPVTAKEQAARAARRAAAKDEPAISASGSDSRRTSARPSRGAQAQDSKYESYGPGAERKKRPSVTRRESSVLSETPPPGNVSASHKKRSTMNSRDAAYELAIAASLKEQGKDGGAKGKPLEDLNLTEGESIGSRKTVRNLKRARTDEIVEEELEELEELEDEEELSRQGKKASKDDDPNGKGDPNKPKHPNQYTYRPKSGSTTTTNIAAVNEVKKAVTASPSRRHATANEGASTRRAGISSTRGGTPAGFSSMNANSVAVASLTWGLPDHLQQYSHLLPTSQPVPLEVITPRPMNMRFPPPDMHGPNRYATHLEPPTKVRFPTKRITIGEMRKRVRSILEYAGRIQLEEANRNQRAKMLGLEPISAECSEINYKSSSASRESSEKHDTAESSGGEATEIVVTRPSPPAAEDRPPVVSMEATVSSCTLSSDGFGGNRVESEEAAAPKDKALPSTDLLPSKSAPNTTIPKSMQLMDDLTRDLIRFQEMFEPGHLGVSSRLGRGESMETEL